MIIISVAREVKNCLSECKLWCLGPTQANVRGVMISPLRPFCVRSNFDYMIIKLIIDCCVRSVFVGYTLV